MFLTMVFTRWVDQSTGCGSRAVSRTTPARAAAISRKAAEVEILSE